GLPPSLLDQETLTVGADGADPVGVDMRTVFSVVMCGFIPERGGRAPEGEPVQVSTRGSWIRLDARYGTAFRHVDSLPRDPDRRARAASPSPGRGAVNPSPRGSTARHRPSWSPSTAAPCSWVTVPG